MDILRRKLSNLVRGEEGVALVVTLALFMFLYVSSAGVFAIGRAVKDKIALQNAVDAAAYSAAIVEADTLSKIATINRAMAWKYVELVQLHMDYVTRQWLNKVQSSYNKSGAAQRSFKNKALNYIDLTSATVSIDDVDAGIKSAEGLEEKIGVVRKELGTMQATIQNLRDTLVATSRVVAAGILAANLPEHLSAWCYGKVQFRVPVAEKWLIPENSEERFLNNADLDETADVILAERFNGVWLDESGDEGIRSKYEPREDRLNAQWEWSVDGRPPWLWKSYNAFDHDKEIFGPEDDKDPYTKVELVVPLKLHESYFENAAGAITVAVAMQQRNPWEDLIKRRDDAGSGGFYDAFNPHATKSWVYAVASAQAGYRPFNKEDKDGDASENFDYSLVHDETENLRTDDWDAVFVPVRRALTAGDFKEFMGEGVWEKVSESPAENLLPYELSENVPLPRMHNNYGAMKNLNFEELIERIYH